MLPSTEDAATPFWSPDSHYLAFAAYRKQKRSASPEEMPRPSPTMFIASIADVAIGVPRASYFFCKQDFGPISQIAASGGQVSPATRLNKNETANEEPSFLPDGKHFLYPPRQLSQPSRIKVGVLGKPEQDGIDIAPGGRAAFASDHLLFVRAGHIQAQPFNSRTFTLSGDPHTIGEARIFSVSQNGVLASVISIAIGRLKDGRRVCPGRRLLQRVRKSS